MKNFNNTKVATIWLSTLADGAHNITVTDTSQRSCLLFAVQCYNDNAPGAIDAKRLDGLTVQLTVSPHERPSFDHVRFRANWDQVREVLMGMEIGQDLSFPIEKGSPYTTNGLRVLCTSMSNEVRFFRVTNKAGTVPTIQCRKGRISDKAAKLLTSAHKTLQSHSRNIDVPVGDASIEYVRSVISRLNKKSKYRVSVSIVDETTVRLYTR